MAENFFAMIDRVKRNIRKNAKNPEAMIEALELALTRGREDFNADPVGTTLESANLGGLGGLAGVIGSTASKGAKMGSFAAPQADALETARRNAVEMLGLPENNTAMDRAKAMGFDTLAYHGTNADISAFNTSGKGKTAGAGAFFTDNPLVSETYLSASGGGNILPVMLRNEDFIEVNAKGRNWADIDTNTLAPKRNKKRLSLDDLELERNDSTSTDELGGIARALGAKGLNIKNVKDIGPNSHIFRAKEYLKQKYGVYPDAEWSNVTGKQFAEARDYLDNLYKSQRSNVTAIQDPSLVRSRFAAFDPARRNENNLLASRLMPFGLAGLLGLNQYNEEQ